MSYLSIPIRNAERDAVKAVLNDESFATEDDMADAMIYALHAQWAQRDSWALAVRSEDGVEFYWPFLDKGDVARFSESYFPAQSPSEERYLVKMKSPAVQIARAEAATKDPNGA